MLYRCANTIFGMANWTNKDGLHGACKDPVDCVRYFELDDPHYINPETSYGYAGGLGAAA